MNRTFFLRRHQGTRISPGKRLIDLNMGMTHRHELNGDVADDSPTNEGPEVAELFNDWGGRGYDDSIPGEVTKIAPSGNRIT